MRDEAPTHDRLELGELSLSSRLFLVGLRPGQPMVPGTALAIAPPAWIVPEAASHETSAGIWRDADVAAWRRFTNACAAEGVPVALPLWHSGRLSHSLAQPGGGVPVAPSAVPAEGGLETWAGWRPFPVPRALNEDELPGLVRAYAFAARRAREAGFDAVEVHAGSGGLLHQFLDPTSNRRSAPHGGSAEARARLPFDVARAVADSVGTGRLGLVLDWPGDPRLRPALSSILALLHALRPAGLAWLRLHAATPPDTNAAEAIAPLREAFDGPLVVGPAAGPAHAVRLLRECFAAAVALRADAPGLHAVPHRLPDVAARHR